MYVPDFLNSYEIISKKKSFYEDTTFLNIPSNYSDSIFVHNFSIIPIPQSGEKRIVLTWGPNPADMDAYLSRQRLIALITIFFIQTGVMLKLLHLQF